MKTRYMTILSTLVFLGFSVSVAAHSCPSPSDGHKHCNSTGGGGGGGGGATSQEYTVALTEGGFRFSPVDVTPRRKGSIYRGEATLTMDRPDEPGLYRDTWDDLFDECLPTTVLPNPVETVFVGRDDWAITNSGGNNVDTEGSRVTIMFNNIIDGSVDMDFSLIGFLDFDGQFHPASGVTNTITLNKAKVWGADNDNHVGCQSDEVYLSNDVILEICRKNNDGTGCD